MKPFSRIVSLVVCLATVGSYPSSTLAESVPLGADDIYARALLTWAARPSPPILSYNVKARLTHKGRINEERDRIILRTADRIAIVARMGVRKNGSERITDVTFERPRFDPDVTFRLVPRSRLDLAQDAQGSSPRTISHAVVHAKRYSVELMGESLFRDRTVYELKLTPMFDPKMNSVRKMFVDTKSFVTWKVVNEAPYAVGPAHGTFMLNVEYGPVGPSWLITRVTTSGSLRFGLFSYSGDGDVEYQIKDTPRNYPAYCFDRAGYQSHTECAKPLSAA